MARVNLSGDWFDLRNIVISGKASTGKTNLAMALAKDILERYKLDLTVITDEEVQMWVEFSQTVPGKNVVIESVFSDCMGKLRRLAYEGVRDDKKRDTLTIFDCACTDTPDATVYSMLCDWEKRCEHNDNYLIIVSNSSIVGSCEGIKLHTRKEGDQLYYAYCVGDDICGEHSMNILDFRKEFQERMRERA